MDPFFIEDGYSRASKIAAAPGLHPALEVRYRPALAEERYDYVHAAQGLSGRDQARRAAGLVARHLEAWDARRRDGAEANPKDEALVARLHPALLARLVDLILGYAPAEEQADAKN